MIKEEADSPPVEKSSAAGEDGVVGRGGRSSPPLGPGWDTSVFVWGIWGLLVLASLGFIARYSSNTPAWEDWVNVPYLTGEKPVTLAYLWEQGGEHRVPLKRVALSVLAGLTGADFRAPLVFNALAMGGLSIAMIRAAKGLRGWTSYTDAFLPLMLLYPLFLPLASYQGDRIVYFLPALVVGILLLVIVRRGTQLTLRSGALAGTCLLLLPLCAAPGMLYVPALALWLGYSGFASLRSPRPRGRRTGVVTLALTSSALVLALLYFVGYQRGTSFAPDSPGPMFTLKAGVAALVVGFGPETVEPLWPYSGLMVLLLAGFSAAALAALVVRPGPAADRSRALGLLFFLGGAGTLALGLGYGRGGRGLPLWHSYVILAAPAMCSMYFAWCLRESRASSLVRMCLFTSAALAVPLNLRVGFDDAADHRSAMRAFEVELREGAPPYLLVARYGRHLHPDGLQGTLADSMPMLRRKGVGPFRELREDPAFREVPLPVGPAEVNEVQWHEGTARGTGSRSSLTFTLPEPRHVAGIRIWSSHSNGTTAQFRLSWRKSRGEDFPATPQYACGYGLLEYPATVYVANTVYQIRIQPDDKPFDWRLEQILLLIPDPDGRAAGGP